jgi:hypothetical protein
MGGFGNAARSLQGLAAAGKARRIQVRRQPRQPPAGSAQLGAQRVAAEPGGQQAHQPERLLASRRFAPAVQQKRWASNHQSGGTPMKQIVKIVLLGISSVLTLASSTIAAASLILNGDFDTPDVSGRFTTFNTAPAGFGWTITSDGTPDPRSTTGIIGVDVINSEWVGISGTVNPDGIDQSLDIDGSSRISQSLSTVVGLTYTFGFHYSHNFNTSSSLGTVVVEGASLLISETLIHDTQNSPSDMQWDLFFSTFVADSEITNLTIQGDATNSVSGFVVDNVDVKFPPCRNQVFSGYSAPARWA